MPPGTGIVHQVNLEYLGRVVFRDLEAVDTPDPLTAADIAPGRSPLAQRLRAPGGIVWAPVGSGFALDGPQKPWKVRFTKAGTFEFACLIPGHYEAGMKGTVVVK